MNLNPKWVILLWLVVCAAQNETNHMKTYLMYGKAQSCKSTFIKEVCQISDVEIGDGVNSCTNRTTLYYCDANNLLFPGEPFSIIDIRGHTDIGLHSDEATNEVIENYLLYSVGSATIDGILILSSIVESQTLTKSLSLLDQLFGTNKFFDTTVVLVTKSNLAPNFYMKKGREFYDDEVYKKNIRGGWLFYKTSFADYQVSPQEQEQQLNDLRKKLARLKPFEINSIRIKLQELEKLQQEVCSNMTRVHETIENAVEDIIRNVTDYVPTYKIEKVQRCYPVKKKILFVYAKEDAKCVFEDAVVNISERIEKEVTFQKNVAKAKNITIPPDEIACRSKANEIYREQARNKYIDKARDIEM